MVYNLDKIFAALADSTRREILIMLLEDDMAVTEHLQILSKSGLIIQEKRGRVKWCKLQVNAMRDASIWMESFGQLEHINFDAFENFLHKEKILEK